MQGLLELRPLSARLTRSVGLGKMSPIVRAKLGPNAWSTLPSIKGDKSPSWPDLWQVPLEGERSLLVEVRAQGTFGEKTVGEVLVDLDDLLVNGGAAVTAFPLRNGNSDAGEVLLDIRFFPNGNAFPSQPPLPPPVFAPIVPLTTSIAPIVPVTTSVAPVLLPVERTSLVSTATPLVPISQPSLVSISGPPVIPVVQQTPQASYVPITQTPRLSLLAEAPQPAVFTQTTTIVPQEPPTPQSFTSLPSTLILPAQDIQIRPQDIQIPPQNFQTPPQNVQIPPQNFQIPPQNFQKPPQNFQTPPMIPKSVKREFTVVTETFRNPRAFSHTPAPSPGLNNYFSMLGQYNATRGGNPYF